MIKAGSKVKVVGGFWPELIKLKGETVTVYCIIKSGGREYVVIEELMETCPRHNCGIGHFKEIEE